MNIRVEDLLSDAHADERRKLIGSQALPPIVGSPPKGGTVYLATAGPFGVMGGFAQPQGHLQMVMNTVDFGLSPQAALDAPHWQWTQDKTVEVEHLFPESMAEALVRKGHNIQRPVVNLSMGRGQIIWHDEHGVLAGGTEPRTGGAVAAWQFNHPIIPKTFLPAHRSYWLNSAASAGIM